SAALSFELLTPQSSRTDGHLHSHLLFSISSLVDAVAQLLLAAVIKTQEVCDLVLHSLLSAGIFRFRGSKFCSCKQQCSNASDDAE
ncbi:hypothetical protein LINPERPRIM_LOCUS15614, partial [Linum perenne]